MFLCVWRFSANHHTSQGHTCSSNLPHQRPTQAFCPSYLLLDFNCLRCSFCVSMYIIVVALWILWINMNTIWIYYTINRGYFRIRYRQNLRSKAGNQTSRVLPRYESSQSESSSKYRWKNHLGVFMCSETFSHLEATSLWELEAQVWTKVLNSGLAKSWTLQNRHRASYTTRCIRWELNYRLRRHFHVG